MNTATSGTAGIPEVLREFIRPDEDDDTSIRLPAPARDGNRRIGMLIIPEIQYKAWKTFFPKDMEKGPQSRYQQSRRVFFAVDDLPADAPTSLVNGEESVFFSGHPDPIHAGEWIGNPPAELPAVSYADITRLLETPAPKSQPADPQEPTPAASSEGRPDGSGIPQEMKNANQWLIWRYEERDGKKTKVPLNPMTSTPTSAPAAAWSYEECKQTADRRGIGIGFSLKNGFVGIDYDHVLDSEGTLKPEYAGLMEEIQALNSYTEVSPSGEGLHVFVRCEDIPPECKAGKHTERGEIYPSGRFFTVTGRIWKESPSQNISIIPAEVYRRVYNRIAGIAETPADEGKALISEAASKKAPTKPAFTDDEVIYRVQKTAKGRALWKGDTSGYPSPSEADEALMTKLAGITGMNKAQMMRVFLKSGLSGRKKTGRPDYISRTIESACEYVAEQQKKTTPVVVYEDDEPDEQPEDTYDYEAEDAVINSLMDRAPEPLKALVRYYKSISVINQPLFALISSMAAGGVVLSRNWITAPLRFTEVSFPPSTFNDYYMLIAPTGRGKDTVKKFFRDVVPEFETSRGMSVDTALHTALQQFPRFVLFIDEAGLRAAEAIADPHKSSVESMLMDIYSDTGTVAPERFSQGKDSPFLRPVIRPGLTVIRTTTQGTLVDATSTADIESGSFPRNVVGVSDRPRPPTAGDIVEDDTEKRPDEILYPWKAWKKVHIGRPDLDTYSQSISPISVVKDEIGATEFKAACEMRMRNRGGKPPKPPYSTDEKIRTDPPITVRWSKAAKREIGKLYNEIEKLPPDHKYRPVNDRKLQHIIKHAAIIAIMRDGISTAVFKQIEKKYEESPEGKAAIEQEKAAATQMEEMAKQLANAQKKLIQIQNKKTKKEEPEEEPTTKSQNEEEEDTDVREAKEALKLATQAHEEAYCKWEEAKSNLNDTVSILILKEKLELFDKIVIDKQDVEWAADFINLYEVGAKKLVMNDIVDKGFMEIEELIRAKLKEKNGILPISTLRKDIKPLRELDKRNQSKSFWEFMEAEGFTRIIRKGGTSLRLPDVEMNHDRDSSSV